MYYNAYALKVNIHKMIKESIIFMLIYYIIKFVKYKLNYFKINLVFANL